MHPGIRYVETSESSGGGLQICSSWTTLLVEVSMAKRRGKVFDRRTRESMGNGTKKLYPCTPEVRKVLGQGSVVLFHVRVYSRSGNGRLGFSVFEGGVDANPRDEGLSVTPTGTFQNIVTTGSFKFVVAADFMADLEVVAELDASAGAALETVEFELTATVIDK